MSTPSHQLIREAEAAAYLSMNASTLRQWRYKSRGPAYHKLGARVLYRVSELEAFVEQSKIACHGSGS